MDLAASEPLVVMAEIIAKWSRGLWDLVRGYSHHAGDKRQQTNAAYLWLGYHIPVFAERALKLALEMGNASSTMQAFTQELKHLQSQCRRQHPDYQARILMAQSLRIKSL